MANTGALDMPTRKCCTRTLSFMRAMYICGGMSRSKAPTVTPPASPASMAMKVSSGSITSRASTRGITSRSIGSSPRVRIASISSRAFIVPIWAVKAEAVRPATTIAVISTASSRKVAMATSSTTKISAPKSRRMVAPRKAITAPIR